MKNLYHKTARPQLVVPQLDSDVTTDVVIVGGGYTGLTTALHLAESGVRALILEAGDIGHGCSGRNGGQVNPGLKVLPDGVEAHFGAARGQRMNQMASDAAAEVFNLIQRFDIDCAPSNTGTIRAAIDDAGVAQVKALVAQCQNRGWPVHFADAQEMRALTGASIYRAGAFDARGGHINPLGYARGLGIAAQAAGASLYANSKALSLERAGDGWTVRTAKGSVQAAEIVVATNGYTDDLWPGMRTSIVPVWTYIAATDPLPAEVLAKIMPCRSALYEAAWDVVYYRVDDAGRLLMGGRGPQRDARVDSDYNHLISYAQKLWPDLRGVSFPWAWHGQVAITPDHFPHLVEPEPHAHLMFGYNGRGIAVSTASGRMVAQRILSGHTADVDLLVDPTLLPVQFHGFWKTGAELTMAWHRFVDVLRRR